MGKPIWIKGTKYYHYDNYRNKEDAYKEARRQKRRNKKCKYFVIETEDGFFFPTGTSKLYLTKVMRLSFF